MKSKTLLVSNIFSTLYSVFLLWTYGGSIIKAGGLEYLEALGSSFEVAFKILGTSSDTLNILTVILVLLCAHIVFFALGMLFGWIGYLAKKSGLAKFAATLYLLGTICFPIYFFIGLPITIVGFIGGGKQKKINKTAAEVPVEQIPAE